MFKRVEGGLVVCNKVVKIPLDGKEHGIYLNKKNLNVEIDNVTDGNNFVLVATCKISKNGEYELSKQTNDFDNKNIAYPHLGRSKLNNFRIHSAPLFGDGGLDIPVSGYLEGLPIDFNYNGFFYSSISLDTYGWAAGRSCFNSVFLGDPNAIVPYYTALPLRPCGVFSPLMEFELAMSIMCPIFGIDMLMRDAGNYVFNMLSIAKFLYPFRRYTDLKINTKDLFSIKVNGSIVEMSPIETDEPESPISNATSGLSMFNLMQ